MRGRLLLFAALIVACAVEATDYRKLSSHVRNVMVRQESQPSVHLSRSTIHHPSSTARLTAFVRTDGTLTDAVWQEYGCRQYAQEGDIAIVSIPLENLGALTDLPAIRRIEASPSGSLNMDTTAIIVGANKVHLPQSPIHRSPSTIHRPQLIYTGEGVVVGVMDIGFDLTHPNFYDQSATRYRIGAFWDQLSPDTVGSEFPVGRDYTGAEVVLAQQHSYDGLKHTHGTHTLGIAAGSGYQSPYQGIAYDADICVVSNAVNENAVLIDSADYDKYTTAVDALGFKYIFDYADRQGKPCVASLSEGYPPYIDEEDSLYSAFIDSISGPGHIIVASAGNEGTAFTYAAKPAGVQAAGAFVNVSKDIAFYRIKTDAPLALSVYAYGGEGKEPSDTLRFTSVNMPTDSLISDTLLTDTLFLRNDTCAVLIGRYPSAFTNDTIYCVYLLANKPLPILPDIALVMEGADSNARLYGSSNYGLANRSTDRRWNAAERSHNIHAPGCFPSVVCVGATAHRLGFTNYKGEYRDFSEGRIVGQLSPYSSTGPAMSELLKPNVVAPGDNIISSYSSFYLENNPNAGDINSDVSHFDFQGRTYAWNANTGTSMATPVVTGVIALWLQAKPDLTPQQVMDVLSHTCRQPEATLTYPNATYGYGEVDAYRGLLYILGIDRIEEVSDHQPRQASFRLQGRTLLVEGADDGGTVSIFNLGGQLLRRVRLSEGVAVDLGGLPTGVYAVQLNTGDRSTTGSTIIRLQ